MKTQDLDIDDMLASLGHYLEETQELPTVEVVRVQPGDILTLTTPKRWNEQQVATVSEQLKGMIPEGVNLAILDGGAKFTVVRLVKKETV